MRTFTATERRAYAIARARAESRAIRAALVAEVDHAVAAVGWHQARPIVAAMLPKAPLSGPRGRWRGLLDKRSTARLLGALAALPAQGRFALGRSSQPSTTVSPRPREVTR
ncbi:MAG: hypothetical protein M0020_05825 [Actinomycetota bacterium]|nr:hypothetical protein [Actinomycetota bacterium]